MCCLSVPSICEFCMSQDSLLCVRVDQFCDCSRKRKLRTSHTHIHLKKSAIVDRKTCINMPFSYSRAALGRSALALRCL